MNKTTSLLAISMLTAMLLLTVPPVQAVTYSAHTIDLTGLWHVWITVDTTRGTLRVEWAEPCIPFGYYPFGSYIHMGDPLFWLWNPSP